MKVLNKLGQKLEPCGTTDKSIRKKPQYQLLSHLFTPCFLTI